MLLASQDGGLDGSSISDGLIGIDRLVQLLAIEEVGQQLLDLGDSGGASDEDKLMDSRLVQLGIAQGLLNRVEGSAEEVSAKLLKPGPGDGRVEVDALKERVNLNVGLGRGRQGSLGSLAGSPETSDSSLVRTDVLLVLALELLDEVVDHPVVKVLSSQVGVTSGRLDFEDAVLNGEDGDVKSAATKVKDEDIVFLPSRPVLLVQAVGDGGSSGFVDDSENVETGDDSGILGGLALGVVEVSRN